MYHIPNDKRALRSAEAISQGMISCLKHKNIDQITVTDVWKASHVGRATFYRLFDNTLDVLSYESDKIFTDIIYQLKDDAELSIDEANIRMIHYGMEHSNVIGAITFAGRTDILLSSILKQKDDFFHIFAPKSQTHFDENVIHSMFLLECQFLEIWIKNGKKQTAAELYADLKQTVQLLAASL